MKESRAQGPGQVLPTVQLMTLEASSSAYLHVWSTSAPLKASIAEAGVVSTVTAPDICLKQLLRKSLFTLPWIGRHSQQSPIGAGMRRYCVAAYLGASLGNRCGHAELLSTLRKGMCPITPNYDCLLFCMIRAAIASYNIELAGHGSVFYRARLSWIKALGLFNRRKAFGLEQSKSSRIHQLSLSPFST